MSPAVSERSDLASTVAQLLERVSEPPPFSTAHQRVLREAMLLMAERGYHAASLRELARRLEIQQPSLYHYFSSKQELVEQVVQLYARRAVSAGRDAPNMPSLSEGLRYALGRIVENYRSEEHVAFMGFLLAIGPEVAEVQTLARQLLLERAHTLMKTFVDLYVDMGELREQDSGHLVELLHNAVAMRMLSRHLLFGGSADPGDDEEFLEFVVDCSLRGVRARREERP